MRVTLDTAPVEALAARVIASKPVTAAYGFVRRNKTTLFACGTAIGAGVIMQECLEVAGLSLTSGPVAFLPTAMGAAYVPYLLAVLVMMISLFYILDTLFSTPSHFVVDNDIQVA